MPGFASFLGGMGQGFSQVATQHLLKQQEHKQEMQTFMQKLQMEKDLRTGLAAQENTFALKLAGKKHGMRLEELQKEHDYTMAKMDEEYNLKRKQEELKNEVDPTKDLKEASWWIDNWGANPEDASALSALTALNNIPGVQALIDERGYQSSEQLKRHYKELDQKIQVDEEQRKKRQESRAERQLEVQEGWLRLSVEKYITGSLKKDNFSQMSYKDLEAMREKIDKASQDAVEVGNKFLNKKKIGPLSLSEIEDVLAKVEEVAMAGKEDPASTNWYKQFNGWLTSGTTAEAQANIARAYIKSMQEKGRFNYIVSLATNISDAQKEAMYYKDDRDLYYLPGQRSAIMPHKLFTLAPAATSPPMAEQGQVTGTDEQFIESWDNGDQSKREFLKNTYPELYQRLKNTGILNE